LGIPFIGDTGTQIQPCYLILNTIPTKPSLISVGIGLLQFGPFFSKCFFFK